MQEELLTLGVNFKSTKDSITIVGRQHETNKAITLSGHKDHRIVMALSIAATMLKQPIWIEEAQYISKSYPTFFEDLSHVGIQVEVVDE